MEVYEVTNPATPQELDAVLRANPLGSKFQITVKRSLIGNDIAKRRGVNPEEEEATFSPASIDVGQDSKKARTIMTMGEVAIKGVVFTGRISVSEKGDDGDDNFPELLIV